MEGRNSDEKKVGGSSDVEAFLNVLDINVDQDPFDATHEQIVLPQGMNLMWVKNLNLRLLHMHSIMHMKTD